MISRGSFCGLVTAGLCAFALTTPQPAHARGAPDDEAVATELFNAGRDRMKQGDYASACPKLAESVRLKPTVGALAKLAACEEHERHLVGARARWEQALNLAHSLGDDREASVAQELARIDAVVPKIALTSQAPLPEGTLLRVDGRELGSASIGVPLPVEAGAHEVRVSAPGKKPWLVVVTTAENGTLTSVAIPALEDLPAEPDRPPNAIAPPPPKPPPVPAAAPRPAPSSLRVAGLATAGAGVIALGIGAALGFEALAERSDAHCTGTVCPDSASGAKLDDAKSWATGSTVAVAVGAGLVAVGAVIWIVAPRNEAPRAVSFEIHPSLGGLAAKAEW